jgi:hypothetical protein
MMNDEREIGKRQYEEVCPNEMCRTDKSFRHWIAKVIVLTLCVVFVASVGTLLFASVAQDKDIQSGFIGDFLSGFFDVLKAILE